jgi:hypothetical protein
MKRNFIYTAIILGLISVGTAFAADTDMPADSNVSADLEKLNITRTNNTNFTRRLVSAVPGVEGRIIRQEPAGVVAQDTPSAAITTEPPITLPAVTKLPPEPEEKPACGPTLLIALTLIPLALRQRFNL